jgi:hypothetical protein
MSARVLALALSAFAAVGAEAAVMSYSFTATDNHSGTFSYDDAAATVGNGPFSCCAAAYDALNFTVDGTSVADPLLVVYQNYGGNQWFYFTAGNGSAYVQLNNSGTGLITSSAASQMDGRTLGDFDGNNYLNFDGGFTLTSLTFNAASSVPEPAGLAMFGLAALGFMAVRRKQAR